MALPYTPLTWANAPATTSPVSAANLQHMETGIADASAALVTGSSYTPYSPTWTLLTVGNGSVNARYGRVGKMIHYVGRLTWGTTTSATGIFYPSLPVAAQDATINAGSVWTFDSSATLWSFGVLVPNSYFICGSARANATVPWTWATGDIIDWSVLYEAA